MTLKSHIPDVLAIGPMKGGTTWVHEFLASQGSICLPQKVKETFFFDKYFQKNLEWYASHFQHYSAFRHRHIVEVAPSYFHSPDAPYRVSKILGNVPIIVTLRDPVMRSWSHYLHMRRYGYTRAGLRSAAEEFPQILTASRYSEMLTRWEEFFPRSSVSVLWQEDLADNCEVYAARLCVILDIPFNGIPDRLREPTNEAANPFSVSLAALGRRTSYALRSKRLYGIVNLAKRLGLKRLFFGEPGYRDLPRLSKEDEEWLRDQLWPDYESLPREIRSRMVDMPRAFSGGQDHGGS